MVVSPMCMYSSTDGFANNWHLVHLGSRAVGGAGLIISEATAVSPEGRISINDLGLWKDAHIPALHEIVQFIKGQGCVAGIQLAHAGRKASTSSPWEGSELLSFEEGGWETVAPSAIPFHENDRKPLALDDSGIEKVKTDFREAAKRAVLAGFEVIEIHAAHGYLFHQFLSPLSNERKDEYGGSFENRCRLLLEVVDEVRDVWPEENPLFVRISVTDWVAGGWSEEESIALANQLKNKGVDLIDCSSGGIVPYAKIPVEKGYQIPFAEAVRKEAKMLTGAVGLITTAGEAEEILLKGQADLIFMAREFLRNPYFPMGAAKTLEEDISWPPQYERAKK